MYTHMYAKKGKGGGDAGAEADFIGEGKSYMIALKCSKITLLQCVKNVYRMEVNAVYHLPKRGLSLDLAYRWIRDMATPHCLIGTKPWEICNLLKFGIFNNYRKTYNACRMHDILKISPLFVLQY